MNNYLPLLVQNESFSQPLAATPGDTLRGRERTISTESTSNLYKPWQPQPPSGTLIIIPRFLPPPPPSPPFPRLETRARDVHFIIFFFPSLFFSPSPPPIPFGSSSFASIASPSYTPRLSVLSSLPNHHPVHHPAATPVSHTREAATTIERAERVISRDVDEVEVIPKGRRGRGIPPSERGCEGSNGEERVARGSAPVGCTTLHHHVARATSLVDAGIEVGKSV